jgi:hypothetical protein
MLMDVLASKSVSTLNSSKFFNSKTLKELIMDVCMHESVSKIPLIDLAFGDLTGRTAAQNIKMMELALQ